MDRYLKRVSTARIIGMSSSFMLVLLTLLTVFPIIHHEGSAEAAYIPAITTLSITSASTTASVDITPISSNGTFASSDDIGLNNANVAFDVTTNNLTGYSLSIDGSDTTGELTNINTADTLSSITSTTDANTFATGASSTYTNKWGIKPSKLNSTTNTNYLPAPTTSSTITMDTTTAPNTTANSYTIGIGARVDYTKPNGTYTNTFVLTAVGNPISYQINYDDTTSDTTVTNIPADEGANDIEASGFTLSSTVPERTGYTFNKWCDGTVTHIASGNSTCSGTEYAAGASYNFSSVSGSSINTANLYAMWNVNTYNVKVNFAGVGVSNVTFTATGQTTRTVSTSGGTATLTYGIPYTMTMNLTNTTNYKFSSWALNNASYGTLSSTTTNPATFTANKNSNGAIITATGAENKIYMQNVTSSQCTTTPKTVYDNRDGRSYVIQKLADGKCWMMTNLNLGATTLTTNLTSANTNLSTTVTAATFNSWKKSSGTGTYTAAELIPVSGTDATSQTPYGTLYNYCATSAGTICTSSNSSNATYDICPKGWRLPTGGSSGEFRTLYNNASYNTNAKLRAPYTSGGAAFALAGFFYNSTPTSQGSNGRYWSSTRLDNTDMYGLGLYTSSVSPASSYGRDGGNSIRCVLK